MCPSCISISAFACCQPDSIPATRRGSRILVANGRTGPGKNQKHVSEFPPPYQLVLTEQTMPIHRAPLPYPIPTPASLDSIGTGHASGRLSRPQSLLAAGISLPRLERLRDHALLSQRYCVTLGKCLSLSHGEWRMVPPPPAQHGTGSAAFLGSAGIVGAARASVGGRRRMGGMGVGEPRLASRSLRTKRGAS
jgi:hypothetical protein